MTVGPPAPLIVVVAIREPEVVRLLSAALEELHFPYRLASEDDAVEFSRVQPGVIYCLGPVPDDDSTCLPCPAVFVSLPQATGGGDGLAPAAGRALLSTDRLTAVSLLRALVVAALGTTVDFVARHVAQLAMFERVPPELVDAFLGDPSSMTRLRDIRRVMVLSRQRAQALVRFTKRFDRAEHLLTALRCATWGVLMDRNLARPAVEGYLGISDRAAFRRACHRAQVPVPHEGMSLNAFSA